MRKYLRFDLASGRRGLSALDAFLRLVAPQSVARNRGGATAEAYGCVDKFAHRDHLLPQVLIETNYIIV